MANRYHLFSAYGVELEYMIVNQKSLEIAPLADKILTLPDGSITDEYNNGRISWSNELVMHVVELKSSRPDLELPTLANAFHRDILQVNEKLGNYEAQLLSGAAHPWMDPSKEVMLWPYGQNEIYTKYNEIFNCKGHGWSNLQSTHLNLPFYDDEEFSKLHTAIRIILPLLPALTASSPVLNGHFTGYLDRRLYYYQTNQQRIPSIVGQVIPERVFSKRTYQKNIFDRIAADIAPFDKEGILDPVWVNSRGAIARFDRGSIEIRIMDIQEAPVMDVAICQFVILLLKSLAYNKLSSFSQQEKIPTKALSDIFKKVIETGGSVEVADEDYLKALGLDKVNKPQTVSSILHFLKDFVASNYSLEYQQISQQIELILHSGNLSSRILSALQGDFSRENLLRTYGQLSRCLALNQPFNGQG